MGRLDCSLSRDPDCILDGEVCALDKKGMPDFAGLLAALSEKKTGALVYFVFDLLFARTIPGAGGLARSANSLRPGLSPVVKLHNKKSKRC